MKDYHGHLFSRDLKSKTFHGYSFSLKSEKYTKISTAKISLNTLSYVDLTSFWTHFVNIKVNCKKPRFSKRCVTYKMNEWQAYYLSQFIRETSGL